MTNIHDTIPRGESREAKIDEASRIFLEKCKKLGELKRELAKMLMGDNIFDKAVAKEEFLDAMYTLPELRHAVDEGHKEKALIKQGKKIRDILITEPTDEQSMHVKLFLEGIFQERLGPRFDGVSFTDDEQSLAKLAQIIWNMDLDDAPEIDFLIRTDGFLDRALVTDLYKDIADIDSEQAVEILATDTSFEIDFLKDAGVYTEGTVESLEIDVNKGSLRLGHTKVTSDFDYEVILEVTKNIERVNERISLAISASPSFTEELREKFVAFQNLTAPEIWS